MAVQLLYNEDLLVVCYHWKVKIWIVLSFCDLPYHGVNLVTFWPLKVTNILLFLAISPLNQMLRSGEQREWSPADKLLIVETNSPCQHLKKCMESSVEIMHTDIRIYSYRVSTWVGYLKLTRGTAKSMPNYNSKN